MPSALGNIGCMFATNMTDCILCRNKTRQQISRFKGKIRVTPGLDNKIYVQGLEICYRLQGN